MEQLTHRYCTFATDRGFCAIAWDEGGITRLQLPAPAPDATERQLLRKLPGAKVAVPADDVQAAIDAVKRYFAGAQTDFLHVRVDLARQSDLFRQIYALTRRIGWGQTTTYGALAKELGAGPEAARDVGQAMARNPVPLIIPCHRVLAAGGKIGGFSAPGGAATKLELLELEGVHFASARPAQRTLEL